VTAFAKVYQGGRDPVAATTVTVKITDATGALRLNRSELVTGATAVRAGTNQRPLGTPSDVVSIDRSLEFKMDLPLRALPAGEYLLTLEASTSRGQAQRHVRFKVR
jgi:hypothetical protein